MNVKRVNTEIKIIIGTCGKTTPTTSTTTLLPVAVLGHGYQPDVIM